jgi:UrcA family protein
MFHSTSLQSLLSRALLALILSSATMMLTLAPFAASAEADGRTATVRLSDLNLRHLAGVAAAYRRIDLAAATVCGPSEQPGSRFDAPARKACVAAAVSHAVTLVDEPLLTAYYQSRTDQLPAVATTATGP